jgi:hypothetical protein
MIDSDEMENGDNGENEENEQPPAPAVRGSFVEIYNPVTRRSYVYKDGEWLPKPDSRRDLDAESR